LGATDVKSFAPLQPVVETKTPAASSMRAPAPGAPVTGGPRTTPAGDGRRALLQRLREPAAAAPAPIVMARDWERPDPIAAAPPPSRGSEDPGNAAPLRAGMEAAPLGATPVQRQSAREGPLPEPERVVQRKGGLLRKVRRFFRPGEAEPSGKARLAEQAAALE